MSMNNRLDRLLGRLNSYRRGDLIEDIDDHSISEYARHFEQMTVNSNLPVVKKAGKAVSDAVDHLDLKVTVI